MKCTLKTWQNLIKPVPDLIVQASAVDGSDSWQPNPIGMSWQYVHHSKNSNRLQIGQHNELVLCAFSPTTDYNRRFNTYNRICILNMLSQNGIQNISYNHEEYFKLLPHFKFVISPEGNGIDTHRTYEALLAGCIPIIERNSLMEEKYKGCPILWTTDYGEITHEYLQQKYSEMINQEYDFSRLFLSYYPKEIQDSIKFCGDFWTSKMTGISWYSSLSSTLLDANKDTLHIVYAFIGKLPEYAITTAYQMRLFFDGPISFIVDDITSQFVERLQKECNVQIIPYEIVKNCEFQCLLDRCEKKFPIMSNLHGRERLFIHSFERFYVLSTFMKKYCVDNVFFVELDNMIYLDPNELLPAFKNHEMLYMFDNINRASSGVAYIKNTEILDKFCAFCTDWIEKTDEFVNEMSALYYFWQTNKGPVEFLPTHWIDEKYTSQTYSLFDSYKSLFDPLAYGCYLAGLDPYHTQGHLIRGQKIWWSTIDCRTYRFKWEDDEKKRKIPYVWSGSTWLRINNLHVHSKDLEYCLSRFPSQLRNLT